MKILGLILELNPPHNGHKYFIDEAKRLTNASIVVCVLTSSFTMRGEISVIDKYTKAKLALDMGVDFVFDYPTGLAMQSSDIFAINAIDILANLGITDIAFGVENDDLNALIKIKDLYSSLAFNSLLKANMDKGYSYSLAHYNALNEMGVSEGVINMSQSSNNILAISYLKALDNYPNIKITLVKRIENSYHDIELNTTFISSATAVRHAIDEGQSIENQVIDCSYPYIKQVDANERIFDLLKYVYAVKPLDYLKTIAGVSEGIEIRIKNFLDRPNYTEFINSVKTKRYSINHINRIIVNMILDNHGKITDSNYYRLVGFNPSKRKFLSNLKSNISIFSSLKNAPDAYLWQLEEKASRIYDVITKMDTISLEYKYPIKKEQQ